MAETRRPSLCKAQSEMALLVKEQRRQSLGSSSPSWSTAMASAATDREGWASPPPSAAPVLRQFATEARLFLELAVPGTLLSLGGNAGPLVIASVVGRKFGETHLAAFTLANLTGNLFSYALMWGVMSAADTLGPQAFGGGRCPEVGLIALRGAAVASAIALAANSVLLWGLRDFLVGVMGQPPDASLLAQRWYRVFVMALPFVVVFNAAWKFLSAQHVMMPLIYVSMMSCAVVLPVSLGVLTDRFGFIGSAYSYVVFQATQCLMLLAYLAWKKPHVPGTFPDVLDAATWRKALDWGPLREFLALGCGGMLAQSEWIYWEALGLIIGKLGVLQLSVHTIPNQFIMLGCMAPFSFGTALAIRMGVTLSGAALLPVPDGGAAVGRTQRIVAVATLLSLVAFGAFTVWSYLCRDWIFSFFTSSADVLRMADGIWPKVCLFNLNCAVFGMFAGIATGLGKQWALGVINVFFLWAVGIPTTYHWTVGLGGGLDAAWTCINAPYLLINVSLLVLFWTTDWHKIQEQILSPGGTDGDPEPVIPENPTPGAHLPTAGKHSALSTASETTGLLGSHPSG